MFLREGTIEHPGLFTQILSLMKIFNYKLQFSIIRCKNRDTLVDSASESRISGPRDPHPTLARIHVNIARLAYLFHLSLSCIASVSSTCLHLHYIKIAAFSSNRTLSDHAARRPTRLICFAPRRHSHRARVALKHLVVRLGFGNPIAGLEGRSCLQDILHTLAPFVLSISLLCSPAIS